MDTRNVRRRLHFEFVEGDDTGTRCAACDATGCPSLVGARCPRDVPAEASDEHLNERANGPRRRDVLEPIAGESWRECFLCNEPFGCERSVFVPGCDARHMLCVSCLRRSLARGKSHYRCSLCRARVFVPAWLASLMQSELPPNWTPERVAQFLRRTPGVDDDERHECSRRAAELQLSGRGLGAILEDESVARLLLHASPASRLLFKARMDAFQ
jgi:hypothetical protein